MVLVDPDYRKQGIGTQLLEKTIQHLDHTGIRTMKLDATPLGKPLYTKLGFVDEYEIERWILKRPPAVSTPARSTCPRRLPVQLEQTSKFDSELFRAGRSFLRRTSPDQTPE